MHKFHELYHKMMYLMVDLKRYAENRIDIARSKKAPSHEDLHPNTRFIENQLIRQIEKNEDLNTFVSRKKLDWSQQKEFIRDLYNQLIESDLYKDYMSSEDNSYEADKAIVLRIYDTLLPYFDPLFQQLEEQSIYWNDEVELVISFILKSLKDLRQDTPGTLHFPLFKKEEDRQFAEELFRKTIRNYGEYDQLIENNSRNWDLERIAFMDILIMKMAITEILEFPSIPTKVTLDEYIEIAKYYSTEKSNVFINGILDKVIAQLREEDRIHKQGRGLIGEI
ncbi:MAG: transcription antitermination factor NusB [Bacteroidales bacterium]|nr:transcription antitermination factor NusB [Bacteroidales bacterium]